MIAPVASMHPSPAYTHRLLTPVACLWRPQAGPPMITPVARLHPSPSHSPCLLNKTPKADPPTVTPAACCHPSPAFTRRLLTPIPAACLGRSATDYTLRLLIPIALTTRWRLSWLHGRPGSSASWVKRVLGRAHPASSASRASGRQSVRPGSSTSWVKRGLGEAPPGSSASG